MDWIFYVIIAALIISMLFSKTKAMQMEKVKTDKPLPYRKRDDFLSQAEKMFYATMTSFVDGKATICPKVAVKEIVFVGKDAGKEYMKYFNWIAKKHVDFVLCDSANMNVLCAVELDDSSHSRPDRKKRDEFVDKVFEVSKIPLFHLPLKQSYTLLDFEEIRKAISEDKQSTPTQLEINAEKELSDGIKTPICPKCGVEMVKRKASQGKNAGSEFYGCTNYPRCREIQSITSE